MPRRMIEPDIWRNEKIGNLPDTGRLLFIGIFSSADDDGRLKASPKFLKATVFPYDNDKTDEQIRELRDMCASLGLIRIYSKNGQEYLNIPGWEEHQKIRRDRYNPSKLPDFEKADNQMATTGQPTDNQPTTTGKHSIVKYSLVKSSTPPKGGARTKRADPIVDGIFAEMRKHLGYSGPEKVCGGEALPAMEENQAKTADRRDPIPNYGKEGRAIKRMLTRGFTREEILACWKGKVSQRGGEFVSMTWVNEDIRSKGGADGADKKRPGPSGGPLREAKQAKRDIRAPLR